MDCLKQQFIIPNKYKYSQELLKIIVQRSLVLLS
jgi:hypothetical protein